MVGSRQGRSAAGTSKLIAAKGECEQIYDLTQTLQFENEARKTVGRLMEGDAVRRLNRTTVCMFWPSWLIDIAD